MIVARQCLPRLIVICTMCAYYFVNEFRGYLSTSLNNIGALCPPPAPQALYAHKLFTIDDKKNSTYFFNTQLWISIFPKHIIAGLVYPEVLWTDIHFRQFFFLCKTKVWTRFSNPRWSARQVWYTFRNKGRSPINFFYSPT